MGTSPSVHRGYVSLSSLDGKVSWEHEENGIYFAELQGVFFHIRKSEC